MNSYEKKQERRRERLEDAARRAKQEAEGRFKTAHNTVAGIPFGQPILVGHHSERRHRAALKRCDSNMRAGIDASNRAAELERKAESVGSAGISSDDPEAVQKLKLELAGLKVAQEQMTAINKAWRKAGKPKADNAEAWATISATAGVAVEAVNAARRSMAGDFMFRAPYPPYATSNNSANMRRIEGRIELLTKAATREAKEHEGPNGLRVVENVEANRLQFFFPGKPSADVRTRLKRSGFRWSPSEGAWQRHLTGVSDWFVTNMIEEIGKAS